MNAWYTEEVPGDPTTTEPAKDRAGRLAVELIKVVTGGRILWVTELEAVFVPLADAAMRDRLPDRMFGFRLREVGFDPAEAKRT